MIINIMGTPYTFKKDDLNNISLASNDGICNIYDKNIIIRETQYMPGDSEAAKKLRTEHVIRHELVHAIAEECGVPYGEDEALVDWIAHIIPIVNTSFNIICFQGKGENKNA